MKWSDYLYEEDMFKFIDLCQGADELDGEYAGPVFYRQWRITPASFERGLHMINELQNDESVFASIDEAFNVFRLFASIPYDAIMGEWTVATYNGSLMHLYRNDDEPDIE